MEYKMNRPHIYYSGQIKKLKHNPKKYHQLLKQFLQSYKVHECKQQSKHNLEMCHYFHDSKDRRRNPYINHQFLYNIYENMCDCIAPECPKVHSSYQSYYHPLNYKYNSCQKINCEIGLYCFGSHIEDFVHLQNDEFFRFDLRTFKTEKCYKKCKFKFISAQHQRKTCLFYHNDKDKRRPPNNVLYNHVVCSKNQCNYEKCEYSHNKLQQLYHPTRYKTKFCQFYPHEIDKCDYKSFCSFAHTQNQITENIELIHLLEKTTQFYINKYKTVWCPFTMNHQRDKCVYAHNFQDYRRNPIHFQYEPIKCENWKFSDEIKSIEGAGCKSEMNCKKCHGWMQHRYHPSIYNTKRNKSIKKQQIDVAQNIINKKFPEMKLPASCNKPKGKNVTNPQLLKPNFSKGTPFFKNDKQSEYSAKTKARTNIIESDKSIDGSSNKDPIKTNDQKIKPNNFALLVLQDEETVWKQNQNDFKVSEHEYNQAQSSSRSKSAQKSDQYCATYSNSIKNAMGEDDQILKKLKKQKFNQIQIVNMDSSKIDKLAFLTLEQRVRLAKRLQIYNMKQTNCVCYSKELTRYFIAKKKQGILQKMQQKKVKEAILLKLVQKQITQLSFLELEEKNCLPKLLKQYVNEKEFKQLNKCIEKETKMK